MQRLKSAVRLGLCVALSFAGGALASQLASASTEKQSPYHLLDQLARVLVLVENEYVEPVDRERLIEGSIKGMVAELDPHSEYLPPRDYSIFQGDTEGRFGGIGVEVDFGRESVTVIAPIEGSPAARAGVRPGDQIVAIDNQSVRGKNPNDLVRAMRGAAGTQVQLTIRRQGTEKLVVVTLTREIISVASVASKLLKDNVGYIRIKTFQSGTHAEFIDAVSKLKKDAGGSLTGVLLDLRDNPGGLVHEANAIADEFLTGGIIFTTRHRKKIIDEARATARGSLRRGPLAVLVNEYSASAAELVAGALQDNRRGPVVGARTFGKGSVQTIIGLPRGAGLKLTTMRYYTPGGRAIQAQGIEPDVVVASGYVADKNTPVIRETDLENHLPAEGSSPSLEVEDSLQAGDAGAADDGGAPGRNREVPDNPVGSDDFALSISYQIVTGVLNKR